MSIEAIAAVGANAALLLPVPAEALAAPDRMIAASSAGTEPGGFDDLIAAVDSINERLNAGTEATHALALGNVDNLHQVMLASERTRLAFDLMLQVRGKVLDAYQELLRMQV